MALYSFIDNENKDFLRDEDGNVIKITSDTFDDAEMWLLSNGEKYEWTNSGVYYFNWNEEFPS